MSFTVDEFHDLVRLLEEKPEWRQELRRLALTDELLALPEQVAALTVAQRRTDERLAALTEQVAALTVAQRRTDERLAALTEAQRHTDERLAALTEAQRHTDERLAALTEQVAELTRTVRILVIDVAALKGDMLELRFRDRAASYLSRIVRRIQTFSMDQLSALLDDAVDQGQLSVEEKDNIMLADLVVRGRRRDDGTPVYLLVEISWGVGPDDVERAVQRAGMLTKLGTPVLPVVAGRTVTEAAARLAQIRRVWQVTDGQAIMPDSVVTPV